MAQATLLQTAEIPLNVQISEALSGCTFQFLRQIEETIFRTCLGAAFYQDLKNDLTDFSTFDNYIAGITYNPGDKVKYKGAYYICTGTTNNPPIAVTKWSLVDKFQSECFNELWCNYLAQYLSASVVRRHIPSISISLNQVGANIMDGDNFRPASKDEKISLTNFYNGIIAELFTNMDIYLRANESGCFNNYKGNLTGVCGFCGEVDDVCSCAKRLYQRGEFIVI